MADPPELTVVAEAEPWEREKAQVASEIAWETRELAANLLRIIRGAGKPSLLPQQIINLSGQILEVNKTARAWAIWSAMEDALQSAIPDFYESSEHDAHIGSIAQGSLQFVASRLVHQRAQEAAGGREIASGITELERYRERQREKFRQEQAAFRAQTRKPRRAVPNREKPQPKRQLKDPPIQEENERPASTADFMRARRRGDAIP